MNDLVLYLDKLNQTMQTAAAVAGGTGKTSSLDELVKMATVVQTFKEAFAPAPSNAAAQQPVYVNLGGQNGQGAGIPLSTFFDLDNHKWTRYKEQEEFKDKRETASVGRDFLKEISKAVGKIGE